MLNTQTKECGQPTYNTFRFFISVVVEIRQRLSSRSDGFDESRICRQRSLRKLVKHVERRLRLLRDPLLALRQADKFIVD